MKNRELIGYKTITKCTLPELNAEVNKLIKDRMGWELYKRPQIKHYPPQNPGSIVYYVQTMVCYSA